MLKLGRFFGWEPNAAALSGHRLAVPPPTFGRGHDRRFGWCVSGEGGQFAVSFALETVAVEHAQSAGSPRTRAEVERVVAGLLGEQLRRAHGRRHPRRLVEEIADSSATSSRVTLTEYSSTLRQA